MSENIQAQFETAVEPIHQILKGHDAELGQVKKMIDTLAVKANRPFLGTPGMGVMYTSQNMAHQVTDSAAFKAFTDGNSDRARIELKTIFSQEALVQADRDPNVYAPVDRRLTVRDILPVIATDSNSVEYTREADYDLNARIQASEGDVKGESQFTFELQSAPVVTIAHHVHVSRQVLADNGMLQQYLSERLFYGLRLVEEDLLLNGADNLVGILLPVNHTQFTRRPTDNAATYLDVLLGAQAQLQLTDNTPDAVVINPEDWQIIRSLKDSDARYLAGYPQEDQSPRLWGMRVVGTNSIPSGTFAMLDTRRAAVIRDRETPVLDISREHGTNFTRNLVTMLVEERIALTVVRPSAIVVGTFEDVPSST